MDERLVIVSETAQRAQDWARAQDLPRGSYRVVTRRNQLFVAGDQVLVVVGKSGEPALLEGIASLAAAHVLTIHVEVDDLRQGAMRDLMHAARETGEEQMVKRRLGEHEFVVRVRHKPKVPEPPEFESVEEATAWLDQFA